MESNSLFSQYGKVTKIIINLSKNFKFNKNQTYSAYVTYEKEKEAALAILALNDLNLLKSNLKASFGTTKYCTYFLKNLDCFNKECLYLHYYAEKEDIIKNKVNKNFLIKIIIF